MKSYRQGRLEEGTSVFLGDEAPPQLIIYTQAVSPKHTEKEATLRRRHNKSYLYVCIHRPIIEKCCRNGEKRKR